MEPRPASVSGEPDPAPGQQLVVPTPSYGTSATGIQSAFIVIEQARGSGKEVGSQQERMAVQVTEPALFFSVALPLIRIPQ